MYTKGNNNVPPRKIFQHNSLTFKEIEGGKVEERYERQRQGEGKREGRTKGREEGRYGIGEARRE